MADNYCEFSEGLSIKPGQEAKAAEIFTKIIEEVEEEDGYCGVLAKVENGGTENPLVWLYCKEYGNPDVAERIARELMEQLELDGMFVCSWSYTCSKPRLAEFGGGAFAMMRGCDTVWIDARTEAERKLLNSKVA